MRALFPRNATTALIRGRFAIGVAGAAVGAAGFVRATASWSLLSCFHHRCVLERGLHSVALAKGGKTSMTFRLVFQSDKKTLTDKEVNEEMKKVQKALETELGAEIR